MMIATCPHCGAGRVPGDTCYACKRFYAQSAADVENAVLRAAQRTPALSCVVIDPFMAMVKPKPAWRAPTVDWYPELGDLRYDHHGNVRRGAYHNQLDGRRPVDVDFAAVESRTMAAIAKAYSVPPRMLFGDEPKHVNCRSVLETTECTGKALDDWASVYGITSRLHGEPDNDFRARIAATLTGRGPVYPMSQARTSGRGHFFSLFRRNYTGGQEGALDWDAWREVMTEPLIQGEEIPIRFNKGSRELILRSSVGAVDHLIHGSSGDEVRATYGHSMFGQVKMIWRCLGGARWFQMFEGHTVKGPTAGEVTRKAATEYVSGKVAALRGTETGRC